VRDEEGTEYILRARGRFRREHITPLVGDQVYFIPGEGDEHGWLDEILPRKSQCLRPPAANIDLEILVAAPQPEPDLLLIDRLMIRARQSGIETIFCVNKCDLDPALAEDLQRQYASSGMEVLPVCAKTGQGLETLREKMQGKLCCMAGQSAVGKSTLLNALCGLKLKTGDLSEKILRGRHTTRHAELLEAQGLTVLDTPGFSLLTLTDEPIPPESLSQWYPEFQEYQQGCRFQPCYHDREPDCCVRQAVEEGKISRQRWERYLVLLEELREEWNTRYKKGGNNK